MDKIFNMDNKFFQIMGRAADLMILNLLFLLCCLPVVTIGVSITAMYYQTLKMVRNEEAYIVKGFFHSFRQNLKQGIILTVMVLAAVFLLWLDFGLVRNNMGGGAANAMIVIFGIIAMLFAMTFVYLFPLLAKFDNTVRNTLTNAMLMSIRHLPKTILMLLITAAPVIAFFTAGAQAASLLLLFFVLLGFATFALAKSYFLVKIFDQYIPAGASDAGKEAEAEDGESLAEAERAQREILEKIKGDGDEA